MGPTSVRRNLFHHNLSKRPVSSGSPPSNNPTIRGTSNASSSSNNSSGMLKSSSESTASTVKTASSDNTGEIVPKDKDGGYELDIPVLPALLGNDDGDDMSAVDDPAAGPAAGAAPTDSTGETEINGREKEKIEAGLLAMMCRNRNRQLSHEPAEILHLVQQSLQNKVASLEEDKWMYESETDPRP